MHICERDEECVSLGVDLDAAVRRKGLAKQEPMGLERLAVAVAEGLQQPSGAFDVGEEKRDGARRKVAPHDGKDPRAEGVRRWSEPNGAIQGQRSSLDLVELAGLEPATSWVRSNAERGSDTIPSVALELNDPQLRPLGDLVEVRDVQRNPGRTLRRRAWSISRRVPGCFPSRSRTGACRRDGWRRRPACR